MAVDQGLDMAEAKPAGSGWTELGVDWTKMSGVQAKAELGWHFSPSWSVYGSGFVGQQDYGAGVGIRGEW